MLVAREHSASAPARKSRRGRSTSETGRTGGRPERQVRARSGSFPLHSIISTAGQLINTTRVAGLRITYFAAAGSMRAVFQC